MQKVPSCDVLIDTDASPATARPCAWGSAGGEDRYGTGVESSTRGAIVPIRILLRVGLLILSATQAIVGVWALPAPRAFYDGFPLPGHPWVALLPPYNEHLVRDVGAFNLALTVVLVAAAWTLEPTLVRVALVALLVYAVPHTIFHAGHLDGFPPGDALGQTVGTVLHLLLSASLLALTWRLPARPAPSGATTERSRRRN